MGMAVAMWTEEGKCVVYLYCIMPGCILHVCTDTEDLKAEQKQVHDDDRNI
jgi:hypothetical protein